MILRKKLLSDVLNLRIFFLLLFTISVFVQAEYDSKITAETNAKTMTETKIPFTFDEDEYKNTDCKDLNIEFILQLLDDGLLSATEAEDLIALLETNENGEVCDYAIALGILQEKNSPKTSDSYLKSATLQNTKQKSWGGQLRYKESRDSLGNVVFRRAEMKLYKDFYSARAATDGDFQIKYSRGRFEALFGNWNARDLNFSIPLQNRFGTKLGWQQPLNKSSAAFDYFSAEAMLAADSGGGLRLKCGALSVLGFYDFSSSGKNAVAAEWNQKNITLTFWYSPNTKTPLYRGAFSVSEKAPIRFFWNGLFYIHNDSLSNHLLQLPISVQNSSLWSSQNQKFSTTNYALSFGERLYIPLNEDKTNFRLNTEFQKTTGLFRFLIGITSRNAINFNEPQLQAEMSIHLKKELPTHLREIIGYSKFLFRDSLWSGLYHTPRSVAGLKIFSAENAFLKTEIIFPEHGISAKRHLQFFEETGIKTKHIRFSLRFTFYIHKRLRPLRAGLNADYLF